jgi:hypothetical protein
MGGFRARDFGIGSRIGLCGEPLDVKAARQVEMGPEQFPILITCRDEHHQAEMLERFRGEGVECRALLS